jgi:hypothetical protein
MAEWLKDYVVAIGSLNSTLWFSWWNLVKLETERGHLVESGDSWLGRSGSDMWQASTSKVVPPPVSVKDRWVSPREQVLNVPIACRWYGPGKPSSWSPAGAWLTPPNSLVGSGKKLHTDPGIGQLACCGLCRESFFSGAVRSVQICQRLAKGCYMWTMGDTYGLGPYADGAWAMCDVLVRFSLARCTSIWIVVTLGYK